MTKNEFLEILENQLMGTMDQVMIDGHIRYYAQYISEAIGQGKTEEQVLEELGSPIFIAKTLSDVSELNSPYATEEERNDQGQYQDQNDLGEKSGKRGIREKIISYLVNSGIYRCLIGIVVVLFVLLLLFLLGAVASLAFRFMLPILLILLLVWIFKR